jgi:hypothetical protein
MERIRWIEYLCEAIDSVSIHAHIKQRRRLIQFHSLLLYYTQSITMAAIEIDPDSELKFVLSHNEATPRCILTLRHPGNTTDSLAFKVRAVPSGLFAIVVVAVLGLSSVYVCPPVAGQNHPASSVSRTTQSRVDCSIGFRTNFHSLGGQGQARSSPVI